MLNARVHGLRGNLMRHRVQRTVRAYLVSDILSLNQCLLDEMVH